MTTEEPTLLARLGRVVYWVGSAVAVVIALLGLVAWLFRDEPASWFFAVIGLFFAGLVWLIGRAVLYILSDR